MTSPGAELRAFLVANGIIAPADRAPVDPPALAEARCLPLDAAGRAAAQRAIAMGRRTGA